MQKNNSDSLNCKKKGAIRSGRIAKKWINGFVWAMSQPGGFTRREFVDENPMFTIHTCEYFLKILTELKYIIRVTVRYGRLLYVPRGTAEFCDHQALKNSCVLCSKKHDEYTASL